MLVLHSDTMDEDDYSLPVYKSLMRPDMLLGIPKVMFMIVLTVTIIFMYLITPWCFVIGVVLWIPVYFISKQDPDLFPILLESLQEPDYLEG